MYQGEIYYELCCGCTRGHFFSPWKEIGVLLKIDFEKVYDMVQWDFMEKMLNARDFGDKWCIG